MTTVNDHLYSPSTFLWINDIMNEWMNEWLIKYNRTGNTTTIQTATAAWAAMAADCPCCPWAPCRNVSKRMQDKLKEEEEKKEKKENEEEEESARVEALWLGRMRTMEARMEEIEEKQLEISNLFNHFHLK